MGATNTLYHCLNTQTRLDQLLTDASNPVTKIKDTLGTLTAVTSPTNVQGWQALPIHIPGRSRPTGASNRKVALSGRVRACPTVQTTAGGICTGVTAETTDLVDTEVTVGNIREVRYTIDLDVYRDTCDTADGNAAGVVAYKLAEAIAEIKKQEDIDLVTTMQGAVGDYFDGNDSTIGGGTEKTVNLYSSTVPRVPQPGNLFHFVEEYRRKGYQSQEAIIVGGTGFARLMWDANFFSGDTAATGRDISRVPGGINMFVDYQVDSIAATGANHALTWQPGHVQMLYWHEFAQGSPLRRSEDIITKTTMMFDGEEFDYQVYKNPCDDNVDIIVGRYSQPYVVPEATFFSATCGAEFSLLNWRLGCADAVCDDFFIPNNIIT